MPRERKEDLIRQASAADAPQILAVINHTNRTQYRAIIPPDEFRVPYMTLEGLLQRMQGSLFYLYCEDERVVGVIGLQAREGGVGYVSRLYVLPGCQRRGIGSALLGRVEGEARAMGMNEIVLHTAEKAEWAHRFYDRMGYRVTGTLERPHSRVVVRAKPLLEER